MSAAEGDFAPIPAGAHDDPRLFGLSFSARGFAFLLLSRISHRGRFSGEPRALAAQLRLVSVAAVKRALGDLERCGAVSLYDAPIHGGATMRVGEWIRYRDYRGLPANRRHESKILELGADPYPPRAGVSEKGWEDRGEVFDQVDTHPTEQKAKPRKTALQAVESDEILTAAKGVPKDFRSPKTKTKTQDQSVGSSPARKRASPPREVLTLAPPPRPSAPPVTVAVVAPLELPAPPKAKASPPGQLSVPVDPDGAAEGEHAEAIARWEAERARRGASPVSRRDLLELARETGVERFALAVEDHCKAPAEIWRSPLKCLRLRCAPNWKLPSARREILGPKRQLVPVMPSPAMTDDHQVPTQILRDDALIATWQRLDLGATLEPWDLTKWISPLACVGRDQAGRIVLCAPSESHASWVREHFRSFISQALKREDECADVQIVYLPTGPSEAVRLVPYPPRE